MWFGKNIMTKLGLVLAMAVPALAADVYPLSFGSGLTSEQQQMRWDELMSYKIWGTDSVRLSAANLPDTAGAIGTTANLILDNARHTLGGPILVGGNLGTSTSQDSLLSGPGRIKGNLNLSNNASYLAGTFCVEGDTNEFVDDAIKRAENNGRIGIVKVGNTDSKTGDCDYKKIKDVPMTLEIPEYPHGYAGEGLIELGSTIDAVALGNEGIDKEFVIDVPPIVGKKRMYDYHLSTLTLGARGKLTVRLNAKQSLARFFIEGKLNLYAQNIVQVVIVDAKSEDYDWTNHKWPNDKITKSEPVSNEDYAGNLLFYTTKSIELESVHNTAFLQGTFMSLDTIALGSNLHLAGQLLAKAVVTGNELDGKAFKYVPFDSPILNIKPNADDYSNHLAEGHASDTIKIELDKPTANGTISFHYCFEFTGKDEYGSDLAKANDIEGLIKGNDLNVLSSIPLYDSENKKCSSVETGEFAAGSTTLKNPIVLKVKDESYVEKTEYFKIVIEDLSGAVLATGEKSGSIDLAIDDNDGHPTSKNIAANDGVEDVPYTFNAFEVYNSDQTTQYTDYSVKIDNTPKSGTLLLNGKELKSGAVISSADIAAGKFVLNFEENDYTGKSSTEDPDRYSFNFFVVDEYSQISNNSYKFSVLVAPVNDAPEAKPTEFTIKENSTSTTSKYSEADGKIDVTDVDIVDEFTYKFDDNFDANNTEENYNKVTSLYGIDATSGKVYAKVGAVLNYESADSLLNIRVIVTDNSSTTDPAGADPKSTPVLVTIRMLDENERPYFTKEGPFEVKENSEPGVTVDTVKAEDPDVATKFNTLTYSILDKDVPFVINPQTGVIKVAEGAKLDHETVPQYDINVQVTDGANPIKTVVTIVVTDENEPPIIHDDDNKDGYKVAEITAEGKTAKGDEIARYWVEDVDAEDADFAKDLAVSLPDNGAVIGGIPANKLFSIAIEEDVTDGKFYAVIRVATTDLDYEAILDARNSAEFNVLVTVKDRQGGDGSLTSTLEKKIIVVDVNEKPTITGVTPKNETYKGTRADKFTLYPDENLEKGTAIGVVDVTDLDTKNPEFRHFDYSIIENVPFAMDGSTIVVNESGKMDYENGDEYSFHVKVANCLKDAKGDYTESCLYDTKEIHVIVQDVNEKPEIIPDVCEDGDPTCTKSEDPKDCIGGKCGDGKDDIKDSCVSGNCEHINDHRDEVVTVGVKENTDKNIVEKGHVVLEYTVVDEDAGDIDNVKLDVHVLDESSIDNKTKFEDIFSYKYDPTTHKILVWVKDAEKLNYEALRAKNATAPEPEYKISLVVNDNRKNSAETLKDSLVRIIQILDVNESPIFDVKPCVVLENSKPDSLSRIEHPTDHDSLSLIRDYYDDNEMVLVGGRTDLFTLKKSGPLNFTLVATEKFKDTFDCEARDPDTDTLLYKCGVKDAYFVVVDYYDKNDKTNKMTKTVPITLIDVNEPPVIVTDTIGVDENSPKGTVVDTIKWTDEDLYDTTMVFALDDPSGCFEIGSTTGVVKVKKDKCEALDHETNPTLAVTVTLVDSLGQGEPKSKIITVNVHDVNEAPSIADKTIKVLENTKPSTVVDTVRATDPDVVAKYSTLTYSLVGGDTATFKIDSKTGRLVLRKDLDYESQKQYKVKVRVFDGEFADTATLTIDVENVLEKSEVVITRYEDADTSIKYTPKDSVKIVYTNEPIGTITWTQDGESLSEDRKFKIGKNLISKCYQDPKKDLPDCDTIVVMYSNATPVVTVSSNPEAVYADNFYTIVEQTFKGDTNIYVNDSTKVIYVSVKDTSNKGTNPYVKPTAITVPLKPVTVPQTTLDAVSKIAKNNRFIDEPAASSLTRTPVNGKEVKVSYIEVVGKDTVNISYMTDNNGNPLKVAVVNAKGKVDSIEVKTVTYTTMVGKKKVTVSYQIDALSGDMLVKDSNGTLMVSGASSKSSKNSSSSKDSSTEGAFQITYSVPTEIGDMTISYSVDSKGNIVKNSEGDAGFAVTYSYTNVYGNTATQSLFIVLDQKAPTVEIISPTNKQVIRSNFVEVVWTVDGVTQDTLTLQGLEKGPNYIVRFFRDKAGNEASDTVLVIMKDSKDIELAVVTPVTMIDKKLVEEHYRNNPPKEGQTFSVSLLDPYSETHREVETMIGGSFKTKDVKEKQHADSVHLGPTLSMEIKLPVIGGGNNTVDNIGQGNSVGGLATLDDIMLSNGKISSAGVGIDTSKLSDKAKKDYKEYTLEEYVSNYCVSGTPIPSDPSKFNMYNSKLHIHLWVYTTIGGFVNEFDFKQDLNDPNYVDEAGNVKMFFEMKPDKNGFVRAKNGKMMATGAYLYKVEANLVNELRCDLPPLNTKTGKKKHDKVRSSEELLKPFGYKRPKE